MKNIVLSTDWQEHVLICTEIVKPFLNLYKQWLHPMPWFQFSSVQLLSCVWLFVTPWTAACQTSLFITNSPSLLKLLSIEWVMPSNHLILCCPLLLPSIFPRIRVFSNESVLPIRWPKYWSFSFSISHFTRATTANKITFKAKQLSRPSSLHWICQD